MTCVLKLPETGSKGILTFTDGEYNALIKKDDRLTKAIGRLKNRWVIGMHHNRADKNEQFVPDPLFDFHIAGPGDIVSPSGAPFYQIEMDCSNFCSDIFEDTGRDGEKFWDVLIIARNVRFKSLDKLLPIIRKLFDEKPLRVLAIVPHEKLHNFWHGPSELMKQYLALFSQDERRFFTLLTPSLDYPFPFDMPTIAFFYHHAKTFLYAAPTERHPRVAAQAFAAGLPLIAPEQVGVLLPPELKRPPGFYAYGSSDEAARAIRAALARPLSPDERKTYASQFLAKDTLGKFRGELRKLFAHLNIPFTDSSWITADLEMRLARHHMGTLTTNTLATPLLSFVALLEDGSGMPDPSVPDFERAIDAVYSAHSAATP